MRNWSWIGALLTLLVLTICVQIPVVSVEAVPPVVPASGYFEKYGPRVSDIIFKVGAYWPDLEQGEIDVMDYPVPRERWADWLADPEITMGEFEEFPIYFFALNNQIWPIGHGTHRWINYTCQGCLDAIEFRRALAHLTDKTLWPSFPERPPQETFIPPLLHEWKNPNVTTYGYDLDLARDRLNAAGFNDYDGDGMLEYSPSHATPTPPDPPADMEELPELQFYIRSDDPDRKHAGEQLRDEMIALGIPVEAFIASKSECYYHVWVLRDYHIYTDAWTFDSGNPSDYYEPFYSKYDGPWDYIGYYSEEFDYWFEKFVYATTMEEALEACSMFQEIIARDMASIPQYAPWGYVAHRTHYGDFVGEEQYEGLYWNGFANELGFGFHSFWTYLNAHLRGYIEEPWNIEIPFDKQGFEKGGVLRHGLLNDVESFNPVHAEWWRDWLVLNEIYEPLIRNHPYNVTKKIPWMCKDYTIDRWYNTTSATWGSYVNLDLLDNVLWHHTTRHFNATDVKVTFELMKKCQSVLWYPYVEKLDHITIHSEFNLTIYYSVESCWVESWVAAIPMMPNYIWGAGGVYNADPELIWTARPEVDGTLIGTGPFMYVDRVTGVYIHVEEYPYYFRRLVWPDVYDPVDGSPGSRDEIVGLMDFLKVCSVPPHMSQENPDGTWEWIWGPYCDVNYDGTIDTEDLIEISIHYKPGIPSWPPPWYVDS